MVERPPEYLSPVRAVTRIHVHARHAASRPGFGVFYVLAVIGGALTGYLATLVP